MPTSIITTDDLREFKMELLDDIKSLLSKQASGKIKKYLKCDKNDEKLRMWSKCWEIQKYVKIWSNECVNFCSSYAQTFGHLMKILAKALLFHYKPGKNIQFSTPRLDEWQWLKVNVYSFNEWIWIDKNRWNPPT